MVCVLAGCLAPPLQFPPWELPPGQGRRLMRRDKAGSDLKLTRLCHQLG